MNTPRISQKITHPVNPGFFIGSKEPVLDRQQRQGLYERFHKTGDVNARAVILATEIACQRARNFRVGHEEANLEHLGLSHASLNEYKRLAGKPGRLGEYLPWLASVATNALFELPNEIDATGRSRPPRLSFETGGTNQGGNWDYTKVLDDVARSIPGQFADLGVDINLTVYDSDDAQIKYKLEPMGHDIMRGVEFDYALVRRRRMVADMEFNGLAPLHYFKEAAGMLVMSQVDEISRDKILNAYYDPGQRVLSGHSNSDPAMIAGAIFEAGIHAGHEKPLDIVPIGAMYVASITRTETAQNM